MTGPVSSQTHPNPRFLAHACLIAGSAILLASCATTGQPRQDYLSSYDGFVENPGLDNAKTYRGNLAGLAKYQKVYIEPVKILEPLAGQTPSNPKKKASPAEKNQLAESFERTLRAEFAKNFTVVNRKGPGTLSIRTAIDGLRPNSPLLFAAGYAPGALAVTTGVWAVTGKNVGSGQLTLHAEILDSQTGERYYALVDLAKTGKHQVAAGLSRWGQAEKAFKKWSVTLRKAATNPS